MIFKTVDTIALSRLYESIILETRYNPDSDAEYVEKDNIKEFNYYKNIGIGENISKEEYVKLLKSAPLRKITINQILEIRPELKELAKGKNEDERLESYRKSYAKEKREPYGELSGKNANKPADVKYFDTLVNAFKNNEVAQPPILLDAEGHLLIAGGRTRLAIAYCLNKPINCKVIKVSITDREKAKKNLKEDSNIDL